MCLSRFQEEGNIFLQHKITGVNIPWFKEMTSSGKIGNDYTDSALLQVTASIVASYWCLHMNYYTALVGYSIHATVVAKELNHMKPIADQIPYSFIFSYANNTKILKVPKNMCPMRTL